jgi:hypothetical protein
VSRRLMLLVSNPSIWEHTCTHKIR